MAQVMTASTTDWGGLTFTVPAAALITRVQVWYGYSATPISYPTGGIQFYIAATVRAGGDQFDSAVVKASSWGFTLPVPVVAANGTVQVGVGASFNAPTHDVQITSTSAQIEYESSVLILPATAAF